MGSRISASKTTEKCHEKKKATKMDKKDKRRKLNRNADKIEVENAHHKGKTSNETVHVELIYSWPARYHSLKKRYGDAQNGGSAWRTKETDRKKLR